MDWIAFAIFFAACFGAAATGALFPPGDWYARLDKPRWTPPDWAFPVVWTALYIAISVAAARVSVLPGAGLALAFWAMQIAFNGLWSPVFFGLRRMAGGLLVVSILWVAVFGTMLTFWQLDIVAGVLIAPYLAWVTVAAMLNLAVWQMNPDAETA